MLRRLAFVPLAALGVATAFLVSGAGGAVTSVVLVSASSAGAEADAASFAPVVSDDGRYVTFASNATNLAGVDPTPAVTDIFVRDLLTGTTERITAGNGTSQTPSISGDGRWVAFESGATNLVPGDTNGCFDVFLFDRDTDTLIAVTQGNGNSGSAAVSGDGTAVAFSSFASDLVPLDTATGDVFRWDRLTATMTKASVSTAGIAGDNQSSIPNISDDGDVIVFNSLASNLVAGDTNGSWDVFVHDVSAGTTEAASVSTAGVLAESTFFGSGGAQVSGNGSYVAFYSSATNLVAGTSGTQIFLRDLSAGTTSHVSAGNGTSGGSLIVPSVTDGGRVAFTSFAALVADDTNFRSDVYLSSPIERVSLTDALGQGTSSNSSNGASRPSVSGDGSVVVVQNSFSNILTGTSTLPNVVAYTLGSGPGGGGSTSTAPTTTTTAPTTTAATTTLDVTPPDVQLPGRADLVVTKTASEPASGEAFAPGEPVTYTVEVVNAGTATAVNVHVDDDVTALQLGSSAPDVSLAVTAPDCSVSPGPSGGPVVASATLDCPLGDIPPRGGRRTVTYSVTVTGDEIPLDLTNRVSTSFATNDADESDNTAETTVSIDTGERECEESPCESGPGTTTTTCVDDAVCKYGGEGVMNTICRGEAACGGGPLRELHVCSAGATCKDRLGEPNVFRCTGEDTYCAGVGTFTCTDGARCVANGESSGTCRDASCSWGAGSNRGVLCVESACWTNEGDDALTCRGGSTCYSGPGNDRLTCRSSSCWGGVGRDVVVCDGGTCGGGPGGDSLLGGKRGEVLVGGPGRDVVVAGGGDDFAHTRDGETDDVKCGPGEDHGETDDRDLRTGCERTPRMDLELVEIELRDAPRFTTLTGIAEYPVNTPFEVRLTVVNHGPSPTEAHITWTLLNMLGGEPHGGTFFFANDRVDRAAASDCTYDSSDSGIARCPVGSIGPGETRVVRLWVSLPYSLPFSHFAWVSDVAGGECRPATDDDCGNNRKDGAPFGTFDPGTRIDLRPPKPPPPVGPDLEVTIRGTTEARPDRTLRYDVIVKNIGSQGIELPWAGILFDKAWGGDQDSSLDHFLIAPDPDVLREIENAPPNRRHYGATGEFTTPGGQCEAVGTSQYDGNGEKVGSVQAGAICRWADTFLSPREQRIVHVEASGGTISEDHKYQRDSLPDHLKPYWRQQIDSLYFAVQAHTAWPVGLGELRRDNNWAVLTTRVSPGASPYTGPAQRPSWRNRLPRPGR